MTASGTRSRPYAGVAVGLACLLAVWSLIPFAAWWDDVRLDYFTGAWQTWGWGTVVAALALALVLAVSKGRAPHALLALWRRIMAVRTTVFVGAIAVLFAVLTVLCTLFVFDGNPRNVDGFAQLFQARIFLAGRLWMAPPAELANFATLQVILGPDKWLSQYPPGQSLILAAGLLAGAWWALNPLLAAALAVATWRVARWCTDDSTARLTMILICLSPFVVAVAGSEMSHLAAATLGMGAAAFAAMASERPTPGFVLPFAAGLASGLLTFFRPLDAVAAAAAAGLIFAWSKRRSAAFAVVTAGGILGSIPILWFNAASNGSPMMFGYVALWGPQHSLGFHPVPWGTPLTLTRAIARSGMDLHQLNTYLLDSTLPVLLIVAVGYAAGRRLLGPKDVVPFAAVLSLIALLFFYFHRDVFYGPRFLYGVAAWFIILLARALVLLRRAGSESVPRSAGMIASFAVLASVVFGLVAITPGRIQAYRRSTPIFALHPDRDARQAGITNAVVVIPDGWGTRLIARMWQLGVPVRRSSRIYAAIDACTLEETLGAAEQGAAPRERLQRTLDSLAALRRPGGRVRLTDDANLRLLDGASLTPACATEIEVDRRGYYSYAPYLWLNRATLDGDIVWARDLGPRNAALFARYAGRRLYRYAPRTPGGAPAFLPLQGAGW